jgi:hypothetical protein
VTRDPNCGLNARQRRAKYAQRTKYATVAAARAAERRREWEKWHNRKKENMA